MSFAKIKKLFKRNPNDALPFDYVETKLAALNKELGILS